MNGHDHHNHATDAVNGPSRALWWALGINATFLVIEFIGGLLTHSLALLADAGHMLTDVAALGIALMAHHIAQWNSTKRRTYGYGRVKVLAALLNGLSLWLIVGVIAWEAVHRLTDPPDIKSLEMLLIASAGLVANLASAWMLKAHRKDDINIRGAFLHLMADSLGSMAVIIAGLLMLWGGWFIIDPILSLAISLLILWSSIGIVKDAVRILLESAPRGIKLDAVKSELESFDEVLLCHDLHIWSIGSDQPVLTAHLVVSEDVNHDKLLAKATYAIQEKFGIDHSTLQLEPQGLNPDLSCDPP